VPVLGSDKGEHGRFFTASTGVISNDPAAWVPAAAALVAAPEIRQDMADRAVAAFEGRLSLAAAATETSRLLSDIVVWRGAATA